MVRIVHKFQLVVAIEVRWKSKKSSATRTGGNTSVSGQAERRYVDNRLHLYSHGLIDLCVKHQAGTLLLVNQEEKEELAKKEKFVLRNWGHYDLITKIRYKAERAGIEVVVE